MDLLETYKRINLIYYEKKKYNDGYDDKHGDYVLRDGDMLVDRYVIGEKLGSGSFGQVVCCFDKVNQVQVAVKILKNRKPFYNQGLVEVKTLQYLNSHDPGGHSHTVRMLEHFVHRQHLCIVFELLSLNLYDILRKTNFVGLPLGLVRRFAHQVVHALYFLTSVNVIHCGKPCCCCFVLSFFSLTWIPDLKPENILLVQQKHSSIKVIDFGSSCLASEKMFKYIQSRFYRAPEVILELDYGCAADMWSCGCILVELLTGDPICPGEDEYDQLHKMVEIFGMPPLHMIEASPKKNKLFVKRSVENPAPGEPRHYWELRKVRSQPLEQRSLDQILGVPATISRQASREVQYDGISRIIFRDLISRMLNYDPRLRIGPFEALHHYFFFVDEIARYILDSNVLVAPTKSPRIPVYQGTPATSRHTRQTSRQYTEAALREAARVLDMRMPGINRVVGPPATAANDDDETGTTGGDDDGDDDLYRQLNNMSISPRDGM